MLKAKKDRIKIEINRTMKVWPEVSKIISTIRNEDQYNKVIEIIDNLIDELHYKKDEDKELLLDTLGTLIYEYENRNFDEPKSDPIGNLKFLMEEHGLSQNDLKEIGSQGVVSEILNGKRKLNLRQITELSKRFNVSPSLFIEED